jgi:hypothetical protein
MEKEPRIKDLTGTVFGRLTVLELDHVSKGKFRGSWWKCRCECGKEVVVPRHRLVTKQTRSCGCLRRENSSMLASKLKGSSLKSDLIGAIFGKLAVMKFSRSDNFRRARWLCQCTCGTVVEVSGIDLRAGRVKSCGCGRGRKAKE